MYSIGVIAVPSTLANILQLGEQMQKKANVTYLSYTTGENLVYVYEQNKNRFDGFVFGGPFTLNLLQEHHGPIEKPYAYFNVEDRDYYRLIAQLAIEKPGIDFSRVYFTESDVPVDFSAIFTSGNVPPVIQDPSPTASYADIWSMSLKSYQDLWDSGRADMIVTRFGSMENELRSRNIPFRLLLPSKETMMRTFEDLLFRLEEEDLRRLVREEENPPQDIDPSVLEALHRFVLKTDNRPLSSKELSEALHVTPRSGARILKKLERSRLIVPLTERAPHGVGRPAKQYTVDEEKLFSMI